MAPERSSVPQADAASAATVVGAGRAGGASGAGAEVGLRAPLRRRVVIPLFILPPEDEEGGWPMGGACRLWLHKVTKNGDLNDLQTSLVKHKQTSFMFV